MEIHAAVVADSKIRALLYNFYVDRDPTRAIGALAANDRKPFAECARIAAAIATAVLLPARSAICL